VQRRREGANQNIYINGSVLGLTKKGTGAPGIAGLQNREPNRRQDPRDHRHARSELFLGDDRALGVRRGNGDEFGCFDLDEVFQAASDILEKNPKSASCKKKQNLTSR
jgi:hypothetical protein